METSPRFSRFLLIGAGILYLAGCKVPTNNPAATSHLYITGAVGTSYSSRVPVYWKDGSLDFLPLTAGNTSGYAWGIAQDSAGNIYISGGQNNSPVGYWKNSTFTALSLGSYAAGEAGQLAVDTAGNVWITGAAGTSPSAETTPVYWKNSGPPIVLPGNPSNAWGIQADLAGNAYIIGTEGAQNSTVPYVWKNGANPVAVPLGAGNAYGYFQSSALDASGNVYIFGNQWGGSGGYYYWQVGAASASSLPLGTYGADWLGANGIAYDSGNFAFAGLWGAGSSPTTLLFWATPASAPAAMALPAGATVFNTNAHNSVYDANGNVITPGQVGNTFLSGTTGVLSDGLPVYWQNTTPQTLPLGSGNTWGNANQALVVSSQALPAPNLSAAPAAPTKVSASALSTGDGEVSLSWSAVSGATLYTVYGASGATVSKAAGTPTYTTATTVVVSDIPQGTEQAFMVTASNAGGESAPSPIVTATLPSTTSHVYATGNVVGYLAYWRDGVLHTLGTNSSWYGAYITVSSSGGIYIAAQNGTQVAYWDNGTLVALPLPTIAGASWGWFGGIAVSGTDVYVSGNLNTSGGNNLPVAWKNGALINLNMGTDTAGQAGGIGVAGSSVYIVGATGVPNTSNNMCFWDANGTRTVLSPSAWFNDGGAGTNGVLVAGSSVAIYGNSGGTPIFWYGTPPTTASQLSSNDSTVTYGTNAMAVDAAQTAAYFAGYRQTVADSNSNNPIGVPVYWSGGTPSVLPLPPGVTTGAAFFLQVVGTDIYVSGQEYTWTTPASMALPLYWKNGSLVPLALPAGDPDAIIQSMAVSGTDVYMGGQAGTFNSSKQYIDSSLGPKHPVYWKNGNLNILPLGGNGNGGVGDLAVFPY